jgi:hypothetical protein
MKVRKIQTKYCGLLSSGMCLQRENTRPLTTCRTMKHSGAPDTASSYCHPFQPQKDRLHGCHLRLVEEVKDAVHVWLAQQPKDFSSRGMYTLVERSRRCAEHGGDYVED